MKLVGRIPVEPLDDERLTNIERRIVAGAAEAAARPVREARFSPVLAALAIAVVAIGAGLAGWKLRGAATATAPVVASGEPARSLRVERTGERSMLALGDATIHADPDTAFEIARPAGGVLVELARGKVELEVAPRGQRPPLVVRAGDTDVIVVGTRFSVDRGDGTGEVRVVVTEGVVRVVRRAVDTRVAAGQAWTSRRGRVAIGELARGEVVAADGRSSGEIERGAVAAADGRSSGELELANGSEREIGAVAAEDGQSSGAGPRDGEIELGPIGDAPEVLRDRVASVPEVRAPSATVRPGATRTTSPARGDANARKQRLDRADDPYADLKALIRAQPVTPALAIDAADPATSVSRYRQIAATTTGDEASHAFYSVAVIQHLQLGRNHDALATLDSYLRRFEGGKEHAAALWLRVRISCLAAIDDRCRAAAHGYLRRASEGPAARIAERLTLSGR
ncbi:MAG: FecR domain-containing protein [Kofleriaceae bacterium]